MSKEWIKESGAGPKEALKTFMDGKSDSLADMTYIAMYPDSFCSGRYNGGLKLDTLLEARIFNDNMELLVSRNSIKEDFSWRIASEQGTEGSDKYCFEQYQIIDINAEKSGEPMEDGCINIMSTVGGQYRLPITMDQKRIKIITYVDYDKNGMAYVADDRICSFVR